MSEAQGGADGEAAPRIRVLVADDQAIVREGLVTVLGLLPDVEVVGEAADGERACELVGRVHPDVVLMDLRMPVLDGAGATARIAREHPSTAVLVLTTFADDASVMGALRAGARGYLTKDATRAEVAAAVRAVAAGQTTLAADVGRMLIDAAPRGAGGAAGDPAEGTGTGGGSGRGAGGGPGRGPDDGADGGPGTDEGTAVGPGRTDAALFPELTARETEVLGLIADGLNNAEIARRLFVGVATVKSHINAIFAKLAVRDRAQAIALAHARRR